jgi:hypothetical protein
MDFRDAGRPIVQTPRTRYAVYPKGRGCYAFQLHPNPLNPLHASFVERILDEEAKVRSRRKQSIDVNTGEYRDPEFKSCVSESGTVCLTAFVSTEFYDARGTLLHGPCSAKACACLVEFKESTWNKDDIYGMKLNLLQVKFYESNTPTPPMFTV